MKLCLALANCMRDTRQKKVLCEELKDYCTNVLPCQFCIVSSVLSCADYTLLGYKHFVDNIEVLCLCCLCMSSNYALIAIGQKLTVEILQKTCFCNKEMLYINPFYLAAQPM